MRTLHLATVQIHCNDVIHARNSQHICHELGNDRTPALLFRGFCVWKVGHAKLESAYRSGNYEAKTNTHGGDPLCRGTFACVDEDKEFHEEIVDAPADIRRALL